MLDAFNQGRGDLQPDFFQSEKRRCRNNWRESLWILGFKTNYPLSLYLSGFETLYIYSHPKASGCAWLVRKFFFVFALIASGCAKNRGYLLSSACRRDEFIPPAHSKVSQEAKESRRSGKEPRGSSRATRADENSG
jgi:hypothetical protein